MIRTVSPTARRPRSVTPNGTLSVRILGAPEILVNGASQVLSHLKAQALVYYLAATAQSWTRDDLATMFWSEASTPDALHSLRSCLYHLRQWMRSCGVEPALISEGERLRLEPDRYECDRIEFSHLLEKGDENSLAKALTLYRSPLLKGFSLPDAPEFEDWVRAEEAHLSRDCLTALRELGGLAESRGDLPAAVHHFQRMAEIDPFSESIQQSLIQLLLRQGETGSALQQYLFYENLLHQELNLAPSPETQALLHDVLRQQRSPRASSTIPPASSIQSLPHAAMIGRDHLLQQLNGLRQGVEEGRGTTVLIEGEAGLGKSRLINEFAAGLVAQTAPWIILQGECTPFDDLLSYGPFLEALQEAGSDLTDAPAEPDPGLPEPRGKISWRYLQAVRSLSRSVPLLLLIEDLQWASSATLNLFGFLSMHLHHLKVLLIGSVQHVDSIPALQRLVALGHRRGDLHLQTLVPLTLDDVTRLLQSTGIDSASIEILADWLHARSAGSPFLLNEILAQLRKDSLLQESGAGWRLDAAHWWTWRSTFELPETTHDLVSWRLDSLSGEARQLMDILAVAGRPLPSAVLRDFRGVPQDQFEELVDDLSTRKLILEGPGSTLTLPHHLLRETLLHRLSSLHQRALHQELAEVLEAHWKNEAAFPPFQIALHAVAGEDIEKARHYGMAVLPDLPQDYTGAETVNFVHHLYDLLAPTASSIELATLTHSLGKLHQSLGQKEIALRWLQQSLDWAGKAGDAFAQAKAYFEMSELSLMANDYRLAMQSARAGLERIGTSDRLAPTDADQSSGWLARGHRLLGAAYAMEGSDLAAAEDHLHSTVSILRQEGDSTDLCAALFEMGNIAAQRGDLSHAIDLYSESAQIASEGHIYYYLALALNNLAYHNLLLGQIDRAQAAVLQGMKVAEAHDLIAALLHLYSTRGEIHLYLGEWQEAEDSFRRGLSLAEDLGSLERQAGYRGNLALTLRSEGDLSSAARQLRESLSLIEGEGYWHLRTRLQISLAETLLDQDHPVEAEQVLQSALDTSRLHSRNLLILQAMRLKARILAEKGDWQSAQSLFSEAMDQGVCLGLPLEDARLKAVWGHASIKYASLPEDGREKLESARAIFTSYRDQYDLNKLD